MSESFVILIMAIMPHVSFLEIVALFLPRLAWRAPEWWLKVLVALEATRDFHRRGR
jgi:hypothetical protein